VLETGAGKQIIKAERTTISTRLIVRILGSDKLKPNPNIHCSRYDGKKNTVQNKLAFFLSLVLVYKQFHSQTK